MILINLLCFNEKIMGMKPYEIKIKNFFLHIIALNVIITALSQRFFFKKKN
jgi:hypothetical protein